MVDIREEQGSIVIEPIRKTMSERKYSLDELLSQITDENQHYEVNFGKPMGNEAW